MTPEIILAILILIEPILPRSVARSTLYLGFSGVLLYFNALFALLQIAIQRQRIRSAPSNPDDHKDRTLAKRITTTRFLGLTTFTWILSLPYRLSPSDPLVAAASRVIAFFTAFKLLDLTFARAASPPKLLSSGQEVSLTTRKSHFSYIWLLATQCRYHSFDIAVIETGRIARPSKAWTYGPAIIAPILLYVTHLAIFKVILGLLAIQAGLELFHTLLHPSCPHPLFWQPFAAETIGDFWRIHWHQGAAPFLFSCGYLPARKAFGDAFGSKIGRAAGVLATFGLSGIWHGWAAAALVEEPWKVGMGMWLLFMGHGVACLLERATLGNGKGGVVYRVGMWSIALWLAGEWSKAAEESLKVSWPGS